MFVFFFKQKTAYEMRISDWSSDVCSSDLPRLVTFRGVDRVEGDFEHERLFDLAHRAKAVQRVVAHELVEPFELLVGETRIGFADGQQLAFVGPAAEAIVRIEAGATRSEEHTSELQPLMRISYAVFCLTKKQKQKHTNTNPQ